MRNLGLAGFVVVLGCTVAACAGDLEGKKAPEDTAFAGMALSAECSQCVGDALVLECSAELQACANDPGCFDVSGCLASCDPNDVQCFSQCAQSSLSFQNLSGCAFCGECAQACHGEWTCGDDPGPNCDPAVDPNCNPNCDANGNCECDPAVDPNCQPQCDDPNDPSCSGQCDEDGNCEPPCDAVDQNGNCIPQCDDPNDPSCGGGQCEATNSCEECAYCAVGTVCQDYLDQCQNNQGCQEVLECLMQCNGDPQCAQVCMDLAVNGGQDALMLGECVGGVCGQQCGC